MKCERIIILIDSFQLGGAEKQAVFLAKELSESSATEAEVWALRGTEEGLVFDLCRELGVNCRAVGFAWRPKWKMAARALYLLQELRRYKPSFIISYTMSPNRFGSLFWRLTSARAHVWGQVDEGLGRRVEVLRWFAAMTPKFIANSEGGARFLRTGLEVPATRIKIISNGIFAVPAATSRSEWRNRLGIGPDTFVVCMVATVSKFKDHATLLRAWRTVLDSLSGEKPVLLLAGREEPGWAMPRELSNQLELSDSVRFLGHVGDISGLLGAVDLLIHSSKSEGMPNAVLEGMQAGLPIVASDIPGIRSITPSSNSRFLFPAGQPRELARLILEFLNSPEQCQDAGADNRRYAVQFDPKKMVTETLEFLHG